MKKLTLLSMLALVSAANANHNGFYVGLGLGGAFTNHALNSTKNYEDAFTAIGTVAVLNPNPLANFFGKKSSKMKFTASLFTGYRWKFTNGFTLGAELALYSIFGKQKADRIVVPAAQYTDVNNATGTAGTALPGGTANFAMGTSLKRTFTVTVAPQVGFSVNPCLFVYGEFGFGMAWNKMGIYTDFGALQDDKSKSQFIMSPGAGVDYKFSSNVCVGLKYNYEFSTKKNYGDISTGGLGGQATAPYDVKTSNHIVQLRVSYAF